MPLKALSIFASFKNMFQQKCSQCIFKQTLIKNHLNVYDQNIGRESWYLMMIQHIYRLSFPEKIKTDKLKFKYLFNTDTWSWACTLRFPGGARRTVYSPYTAESTGTGLFYLVGKKCLVRGGLTWRNRQPQFKYYLPLKSVLPLTSSVLCCQSLK